MNEVSSIAVDHGVDDLPLWRDPQAYATVSALLQQHGVSEEQLARLVAPTATTHTSSGQEASTMISMPS